MRLTSSQQATLSRAATIVQESLAGTALLAAHLIVECVDGKPTPRPSRESPPPSHPTDDWDRFYTRHQNPTE